MAEPMYLLDFRRMTVEKIADPELPSESDKGAPELPEGARQPAITFAACPMAQPMYLLDFRRMTVEKIADPKLPSDMARCHAPRTA